MGYHHYERSGCTPISIIVDGSTDSGLIYYLIVYFQTVVNETPVIYFYRIIEIKDESSLGHFEALTHSWETEK